MKLHGYIVEHIVVGPIQTNCYMISKEGSKQCVLVDPGAEAERIAAWLQESSKQATAILLTHGHFDHIMGLSALKEKIRVPVFVAETEKELLLNPDMNCSIIGAGVALGIEADRYLADGECFDTAGMKVKILCTPGHTAGSSCYYFEEGGFVLSGDTVFFESIGRTDLPTGNYSQIMKSIEEKLMTLPEEVLLFPGHGPETTVGYEKNVL